MIGRHPLLWRGGGLAVLAGVLSGCNSTPPVAETPPPPVSVCQPLAREVTDHDDYEGRIAAVETVNVQARVSGYLVKIPFQDGQLVQEEDLLFEIDARPYKAALDAAEAQLAVADTSLNLAKSLFARTARLTSTGAASREEYEIDRAKQAAAGADRQKALANVEQAQLDLDFTKILAPISGKVSRPQVTKGNLISAAGDTVLTTIVSVDPMYVYFDVDERSLLRYKRVLSKGKSAYNDTPLGRAHVLARAAQVVTASALPNFACGMRQLGALRQFQEALELGARPTLKDLKIPVEVALEGETGYPHRGVIDFADNRVNPSTGTVQARGVLPNPNRTLDSGMRARVRVPVGDPHKALLVTERAIGTDQGRKFVYVVNGQNVAERRDVKLGRVTDGLQLIQEGLKPDDRVVVNGIQRVRDGAKVEPRGVPMPGAPAEPTDQKTTN